MVRVLRWVTARFRIFSQRTTAHEVRRVARRQHPDRLVDAGVSDCGHDGLLRPIRVTAFPTSGACSRAYTSSITGERCPVCRMIECASAPCRKASVTNPARSECPPSFSTWAGVNPAAAARRWIISAIASPNIALAPMAPVLCTAGNNGRAGGVGQAGAAAAVQHGVLFLTFLSPTACRSGGLAAQDREDRAAAGAVGGGVPRVQDLPPPDVGAGRAGDRVPPVGCECSNYLAHFGRTIWRYARPVTTLRRAYTVNV